MNSIPSGSYDYVFRVFSTTFWALERVDFVHTLDECCPRKATHFGRLSTSLEPVSAEWFRY